MVDHKQVKLGKQAAKIDRRTLRLGRYFLASLPPPPAIVTYSQNHDNWGMFMNDELGDCTIAGVAHAIQVWQLNTLAKLPDIKDNDVVSYYSKWDGYDPKNSQMTDQGGVELDVLNQWRQSDFMGYQLLAYADPSPKNLDHVRAAIWLFGGVYIGLSLPLSAQDQKVWDVPIFKYRHESTPGSWGGHCVFVCDYDMAEKTFTCITWGERQKMTFKFFTHYCDEVHALLSPEWISKEGKSLAGFDLSTLQTDLSQITA